MYPLIKMTLILIYVNPINTAMMEVVRRAIGA